MSLFDVATLNFYDAQAGPYARRGATPGRKLASFLALLPSGAHSLELGCGGGRDAAAMIARGFDVDASDGSSALAAVAAALLGRPARVMRFDQFAAVEQYDAIWANASLLHVPRAGLADVLARVWRALRTDGVHVASFKLGDGEERDRFGRYYNRMQADELVVSYAASGRWEMLEAERFCGAGYDGAQSDWIGLVMRRVP